MLAALREKDVMLERDVRSVCFGLAMPSGLAATAMQADKARWPECCCVEVGQASAPPRHRLRAPPDRIYWIDEPQFGTMVRLGREQPRSVEGCTGAHKLEERREPPLRSGFGVECG